ncbi:hypothetical protein [Nocardia sp. NPDC047654]|uniref:hypothetical protein n=1 Tax=Nocardia sp. NPDC047654 TaxID=3364314 RepID=UPI0037141870
MATTKVTIDYAQIGSLAGTEAALPAALLRSRRIRIGGSGAGSVSKAAMIAELPQVRARFALKQFLAERI